VNQHQDHHPSSSFEDRLLGQLRAAVAQRGAASAAEEIGAGATPAWRRGPRLALAGTAVVAAATAALIVSAGGDGTPAAYAVEAQGDGQVSVEIRSLQDARGLEEALGDAGIPASVDYLATGMACREPRYQPVTAPTPSGDGSFSAAGQGKDGGKITSSLSQVSGGPGGDATVFSINRDVVSQGQTLVITASAAPGGGDSVQMGVAEGEVGQCVPVSAPAGIPPADSPEGTGADSGPSTTRSAPAAPGKGFSTGGAN
jgi:hypothetical protein